MLNLAYMYLGYLDQYFCFTLNSMCLLFSQGVILTPWFSGVDSRYTLLHITSYIMVDLFAALAFDHLIHQGYRISHWQW